jgi:polysaccharide export outer membrane protein
MHRFKMLLVVGTILFFTERLPGQTVSSEMVAKAKAAGISQAQIDAAAAQQKNTEKSQAQLVSPDTQTVEIEEVDPPKSKKKMAEIQPTSKEDPVVESPPVDSQKVDSTQYFGTLPFFGYDIFKTIPDAFKPNAVGPVDPGYMVGPGDVLRLSVWGAIQFQYELIVAKEGTVFIPVAGQVLVVGIPFEKLQEKVKNLLSRHYSGLIGNPPTVFIDLTVAKLRPIQVYIMGEVKNPGGYTVSSYATVFNALYSIGGPRSSGSLRNVKVFRDNKLVTTVDLYSYLLGGEKNGDIRLQNSDLVFIPPRGKTVSIEGEVLKPAVYELKDEETLENLLMYSGNVLATSYLGRVQIQRILPEDQRPEQGPDYTIFDVDFANFKKSNKLIEMNDFDKVFVFKIYKDLKNFVMLTGAVKHPGIYQVNNLTLYDLVFKLGQTIDDQTYMLRGDIIRYNPDQITTRIIPFDLTTLKTDSFSKMSLQPRDQVNIYHLAIEKEIKKKVVVEGEVNTPDTIALCENMTVIDAILQSGGFTRKAYTREVEIARVIGISAIGDTITEILKVTLPYPFDFTEATVGPGNVLLKDRDRVLVRPDPGYVDQKYVTVTGRVRYQGRYALQKRNERLSEIITRAGGLLPDAFVEGAVLIRNDKRVIVDFAKAVDVRKKNEDIALRESDSIIVPQKPNTIELSGNINKIGLFSYIPGAKCNDYLRRAGGLKDSTAAVFITKPGGETIKLGRRFAIKNNIAPEGSLIYATRKSAKIENKDKGPTVGEIVKDVFAIAASALTVIVLAIQVSKS